MKNKNNLTAAIINLRLQDTEVCCTYVVYVKLDVFICIIKIVYWT